MPSPSAFLPTLLLLAAAVQARQPLDQRCNSINPSCGLSPSAAQTRYLSTYKDLLAQLNRISARSRVPLRVGPLIRNSNSGLLDIDIPLNLSLAPAVRTTICGDANPAPTIREAILCTVTRDAVQPPRGNTDAARIGLSTQGRQLYAARLGNRSGHRVFVVTQQHGNEAASTEAALSVLRELTRRRQYAELLSRLDLLFLLRANPDGGEPSADNNPPLAAPYTKAAGFFRHNVDPAAGGGFAAATEPGFSGIVGRGYDLNRYNYGGLTAAIRPVESQAMVAAVHAFRPDLLFDMHGDGQKVLCELDLLTVVPNAVLGVFPSVKCKLPALPVPTLLTQRSSMVLGGFFADDATVLSGNQTAGLKSGPLFTQNTRLVRSVAAEVVKKIDPVVVGSFSRFNQIQVGIGSFSDGTLDRTALALSAVGSGWEVTNFAPVSRPAVTSVSLEEGELKPIIGLDTSFIEPCFLGDNICLHNIILKRALRVTADLVGKRLTGDNGYCAIPLDNGLVVSLPTSAGFPAETSVDVPVVIPQGGELGVPVAIAGRCAGDP